jgi:cobyric acid synthase
MEIDVFLALTGAGVPEIAARSASEAIRREMSAEVQQAQQQLATKADLAVVRIELKDMKDKMSPKTDLSMLRTEVEGKFENVWDKMATKVDLNNAKIEILAVMEDKFSVHLRWTVVTICGGFGILGALTSLFRLLQ